MRGESFTNAVLALVEGIPSGRVMTYGDVARACGSRAARAVGQVMARYGDEVPWWRVVPASGEPIHGHAAESLAHYQDEGTPIITGRLDGGVTSRASEGWSINLKKAIWTQTSVQ